MSKTHIVKQGEHLSGIAAANGFANFHIIWDHPNNAALKAVRDPHVLFPGDKLFIPDRILKKEQRPTTAIHTFTVDLPQLLLRLKLLDLDGKPIANSKCDVKVEPAQSPGPDPASTNGEGILEKPIASNAKNGGVIAHIPPKKAGPAPPPKKDDPPPSPPAEKTFEYDLRIGSLNPGNKLSGQQARLNNLGYFAGFTLRDVDQLLWAAEEFECDFITKPVLKRPVIKPAPPEGEDDENAKDPKAPSGIQDPKIFNRIVQIHGI